MFVFCLLDTDEVQEALYVTLANGEIMSLPHGKGIIKTFRDKKPDKVKDYGHLTLEVGITFLYFLEMTRCPNRKKMLALLKVMMLQLKGRNIKAKYPKEILRMLVQQYSVIGLRDACQIFHACFVNLDGKVDGHVPVDLVQEWQVKESKSHIKHMFSNKSESNIENRTAALPGIHTIAKNFDTQAGTVIRAKKHKQKESTEDELTIMDDLHNVKPFQHTEGRAYQQFNHIPKSFLQKIGNCSLQNWFESNKLSFLK